MRVWLVIPFVIFLTSCSAISRNQPTPAAPGLSGRVSLPKLGPAPELTNDTWLNTDQPLRLADLRGKVVLLDMWTFG